MPLGSQKERALLAILLLNANETVSCDRLVDELWGEQAPERATKAIQTYVSRLRKVVSAELLCTRSPGYVLELEPEQLDLACFERLLAEGQRALAEGSAACASASLAEALALWRGPALAEFGSEPFSRSEGARLEELRLSALEARIDAELALGRAAALVGELESLVGRHPLRERVRGQLMIALYRAGRQAEALAAYQDVRRRLVDELGIEPGRALRDLEKAILRHDPALELASARVEPEAAEPLVPKLVLAEQRGPFVGRSRELQWLGDAVDDAFAGRGGLVMLVGEPGIGKTRTALELAVDAVERGARVLWGRCYEREGAPSYWPWVQAIRSYLGACDPGRLQLELGGGAAVIAEVVPELRERLPEVGSPPPLADEKQARFRFLDSLTSFLRRAAERQPLVVVLDDLNAADAGSLMVLEFVARHLAGTRLPSRRHLPRRRAWPRSAAVADDCRAHAGAAL